MLRSSDLEMRYGTGHTARSRRLCFGWRYWQARPPSAQAFDTAARLPLAILRQARRLLCSRCADSPRFQQSLGGGSGGVTNVSEGQQRVGALAEVPQLLRELGADAAEVAASVGLDVSVLHNPENSIPFTAAGKLSRRVRRGRDARILAFWSGSGATREAWDSSVELMRNAPTWGRAVQDLVDDQHRYVRGGVPYLVVRDGVASAGYAIYQQGTEGVDHFCDGAIAVGFNMMRELCGALPRRSSVVPQAASRCSALSQFFSGPCPLRCRAIGPRLPSRLARTAGARRRFPPARDCWKHWSRTIGPLLYPASRSRSFGSSAPASCSAMPLCTKWHAAWQCIRER